MEYTPSADEETLLDALTALLRPALAGLAAAPTAGLPSIAGADIFSDIWGYLQSVYNWVSGGPGWLKDQFNTLITWVRDQASNVKDLVRSTGDWVVDRFEDAFRALTDFLTPLFGAVSSAAQWVYDRLSPLVNSALDFIGQIGSWLYSSISGLLSSGWDFVASSISWLLNSLTGLIAAAGRVAADVGAWLWGLISPIFSWVSSQVASGIDWLFQRAVEATNFLASHVSNVGQYVAGQTFNYVIQGAAALGEGFQSALEWLMHGAFDDTIGTMTDVLNVPGKMLSGAYHSSAEMLADLHLGGGGGGFTRFLYSLCAFIPTLASITVGLGPIYAADALQNANKIVGPQLFSLTDARDAWLRGLIPDAELEEQLARMGFDARKRQVLQGLFFEPAPPSDLVRFLVREVFDPQQRQTLQLDGDYPGAADAEARKVGLSPETMRNYWAAHWQLPSPSQVYEMLHRALIQAPDVDAYLKAADFSPAWRSKLAAISYNVPGRIDLRRMFAAGAIDEPRLLKGYKDLGYNDADAAVLVTFAKKLAAGNPKELPRGVILEGYREAELGRSDAIAALQDLDFDAADAAFMLDLEDLQNTRELQHLFEDSVEADFKAGITTEPQAMTSLSAYGIPAGRAQLLLNLWRNRHQAKTATLSPGTIQHAVREHLIPDQVGLQRLKALNFNDGDAQLLIALAHPQAPADTPPSLTLAQLFNALHEGLLTQAQLTDRLLRKGFIPDDVRILVELATPDLAAPEPAELTKAELIAAAKKKVLPVDAVQRRLAAKAYSAQDIDVLLKTQGFDFTPTGQLVSYPLRDLTVAQLSKSYRTGLIEEKEFRFRLAELSYADADIDLLVDLATPEAPIV